jgi:hypothetical protein
VIGHYDLSDYFPEGVQQRSAPHTGTDITPYLNEALLDIRVKTGRGCLYIPPGSWRFTGADKTLLSGNKLIGCGSMATSLTYDKGSGIALWFAGDGGYNGGGIEGISLFLEANYGLSTAYALLWRGTTLYQPDQTNCRDLYVTARGNSYWYRCLEIDGSARSSPQGVRVTNWQNIQLFRSHTAGIYISNAVDLSIQQIGLYVTTGSGDNVHITGGSIMVTIEGANLVGNLYAGPSNTVYVQGRHMNIIGHPLAVNWEPVGPRYGTIQGTFGGGFKDRTWVAS